MTDKAFAINVFLENDLWCFALNWSSRERMRSP